MSTRVGMGAKKSEGADIALKKENVALKKENAGLSARVAELEDALKAADNAASKE